MKNLFRMTILTFIFVMIAAACAPSLTSPAESSLPEGALETSVAATVDAMVNEEIGMIETNVAATVQAIPTHTPLPTATAELIVVEVTSTPVDDGSGAQFTVTPIVSNPSSPGTSKPLPREYACSVYSQSIKDWTAMEPRQDFDMRWTILNTGTKAWTMSGTDYKFVRGEKMHRYGDIFDLPKDVGPGGKINLVIDMEAPSAPGTYVTYWGLANGSQHFCQFYLIITVK